jgi:hypothetical protein
VHCVEDLLIFHNNLNVLFCITGSYQEARRKLTVAEVVSDINIPSDAEGVNLGRGKRNKRPRVTYSPGSSSGDEEETTLSSAPPVPQNLLVRHSQSKFESYAIIIIETHFNHYNYIDRLFITK